MKRFCPLPLLLLASVASASSQPKKISLYYGYLTKLRCKGKLFISAFGNEALVRRSALPQELGCGVYAQPLTKNGQTNLFLETSTGTLHRVVENVPGERLKSTSDLEIELDGEEP
jgi:hypothetical protein